MSKVLVLISAQVLENYDFFEGGEYWKKKGLQVFSVNVNSDMLMYAETQCILSFEAMLRKQSNEGMKYLYVSHEVLFSGIEILDQDDFDLELKQVIENI